MQLHSLLPHLLFQFKDERDLLKAIEELSQKFTRERENISDYLKDERLTSAYAAFYLTTNIPKLAETFKWMPTGWIEELKACTFIDLGAGPGTFSLAIRELVGAPMQIVQIETSAVMRQQAEKIWNGLYPQEKIIHSATSKVDLGEKRFLFFGHSANEMGPERALNYIHEINPDHILFIEPGTKEFFPQMLKIRDGLLKDNYQVLYPCPKSEECPLKNSSEDWCHQFIQVRQNEEIERISQMARKDRRLMPLMVHAFSRTFKAQNPGERLIRVFPETKFSYEWEVCHNNHIEHYQVMKRSLSKNSTKLLDSTLAGAALETELDKELEKSKRVKIRRLNNLDL